MTKQSRFQQSYRASASKYHKTVGDMLHASEVFKNYKIYQEYPVNRVSAYYDSGREHYDWVILDLEIVIEVMGQQHYAPVRFGGITQEEAEEKFLAQKERDQAKRRAAEESGWTYIVFKYDEEISILSLLKKIDSHEPEYQVCEEEEAPPKAADIEQSKRHQEQLKKAREYRQQQYQKRRKRNANSRRTK